MLLPEASLESGWCRARERDVEKWERERGNEQFKRVLPSERTRLRSMKPLRSQGLPSGNAEKGVGTAGG